MEQRQSISDQVWEENYRGPEDNCIQDTWKRQAKACAAVEKEEVREQVYEDFLWLLTDFRGCAGGRITANLGIEGREATTLFNCYVHNPADIGYKDPDSIEGIYDMLKAQAHTLKSEGGYGMNFSWIRPAGSYVVGIDGRTPGVLRFMDLWDASSKIITMGCEDIVGDKRRSEKKKIRKGAMMGVLNCWHPDIEEFITAKQVEGKLTKFNVSVGITDDFMDAVIHGLNWNLEFPQTDIPEFKEQWDGDLYAWKERGLPVIIYKTVRAIDIWDKIMTSTYTRNEPGVLFLDTINKKNPLSYAEKIITTNPCFHGDERFLTENGYVKFKDAVEKENNIIVDNRISYNDDGEEKPENWIINSSDNGTSVKKASPTFITKEYSELLELEFSNGQTLKCTPDHHIATMDGMVEAKDLKYSPIILVPEVTPPESSVFGQEPETQEENDAFLLGLMACKNNFLVPEHILNNARNRIGQFYLAGVYNSCGGIDENRMSVSLYNENKSFLQQIQLLCHANGISTFINNNELKTYGNGWMRFVKIGFGFNKYNNNKLKDVPLIYIKDCDGGRYTKLISSKKIDGDTVYCLKEPETRSLVVNTISARRCGEISMSTGVCLLFSLNLVKYIIKDENDNYKFDYDTFKKAVAIATRFADNINDISRTPLSEYSKSMKEKRRLGVGVLALGSLHYVLGIRFGSEESLKLIDNIFKTKAETEILTSAQLGEEKGSFKLFDKEKYFSSKWWKTLPISKEVKKQVEKIGEMRNSHRSANAPTGNMSLYAGVVSGGIEPVIFKTPNRWVTVTEQVRYQLRQEGFEFPDVFKGEWFETQYMKLSKIGTDEVLLGKFNGNEYQVDNNRGLTKKTKTKDWGWAFVNENFTKDKLEEYTKNDVFATSEDLTIKEHIDTLKIISKYVDQNSSKTVNIPKDFDYEDFKNVYLDAWKSGIKGITTYRKGTMTSVVDNDSEHVIKRPKLLKSETHKIRLDTGDDIKNAYVTVSFFPETNNPYEVFINTNVDNNLKDLQILELSARMTSLALRHGIDVKFIVDQLNKIDGQYVYSIPNNLAKALSFYINEEKEGDKNIVKNETVEVSEDDNVKGSKCPRCGSYSYIQHESCGSCMQCNYERCG